MLVCRVFAQAKGALYPTALAVFGLASSAAYADDRSDWYIGGSGSGTIAENMDLEMPYGLFSNVRIDLKGHKEFKTGWGLSLVAGRRMSEKLRLEGEVLWHRLPLSTITRTHRFGMRLTPEQAASTARDIKESGNFEIWSHTINLYYDLPLVGPFRPYLGAGIGLVHGIMDLNVRTTAQAPLEDLEYLREALQQGTVPSEVFHEDSDRWGFVWKVRGGASWDLSPALTLVAGYRFMHLPSTGFSFAGERLTQPMTVTAGPHHSFDVGLRRSF